MYIGAEGPYKPNKVPPNIYQDGGDFHRPVSRAFPPSEAGSRGGIIMDETDAITSGLGPSSAYIGGSGSTNIFYISNIWYVESILIRVCS